MEFIIEKASIKNLDEILSLFKTTIEKTCSKDYNESQIHAWTSSINNPKKWIQRINNQYFIIVKEANKIVGFGSIEEDYLDLLFVHPDYLRKGIASLILKKLTSEIRKKGITTLRTFASKTAVGFFKSKHFKIIRENKIMINDVEIINFEMSQKIKNE